MVEGWRRLGCKTVRIFAIFLRTRAVFKRKVWSEYTKRRVILGKDAAKTTKNFSRRDLAFGASHLALLQN